MIRQRRVGSVMPEQRRQAPLQGSPMQQQKKGLLSQAGNLGASAAAKTALAGTPFAFLAPLAGSLFAEGGPVQQAADPVMQLVEAVLSGQVSPEQALQMMIEAGVPQEQAMQILQEVLGAAQQQGAQAPQPAQQAPLEGGAPLMNRGGKAQPSLAEQINWGGKYDKKKKDSEHAWYDPRRYLNDGGMIGHNPDTFINGQIASVHYPTPVSAQNAPVSLNQGGPISINPANKGQFTNRAQAAGMGTQAYANKVMNAPLGEYPPEVRKQANFARNASKWNEGGRVPISSTQPHGPMHLSEGGEIEIGISEAPVKMMKKKKVRGSHSDETEVHYDTSVPPMTEAALIALS